MTEEKLDCTQGRIGDLTDLLPMRKTGILSQPKGAPIKALLKDSWPWSAARISHHLGATLRPRSWTSIARALGLVQDLYTASKDNQEFLHARLGLVMISSGPSKRVFPDGYRRT